MSNANDFIIENGVLTKYVGPGGDVVIPEEIKEIGRSVFDKCQTLTSVSIPNGVTSIGDSAFNECRALESVTLPEGLTSIGNYAFCNCRGLTNVAIPNSVTSIGYMAFSWCTGLADVKIPACAAVGFGAFCGCEKMADAEGFVVVDHVLYGYHGDAKTVLVPAGITNISYRAFWNCAGLECVALPEGVVSISHDAFSRCEALKSVVLPESVTSIESGAFWGCRKLEDLVIPASVADFTDGIFSCGMPASITSPAVPFAAYTEPDSKLAAALGYAGNQQLYHESVSEGYKKYAISQRKKLLPMIFVGDRVAALAFYAENKKITAANFEEEYLTPASSASAANCVAYLLDWKAAHIKPAATEKLLQKELTKDPYNSADMKKIWSFKKIEDGTLELTAYKGSETRVTVPERIGKAPVTVLGDYAFGVETSRSVRPQERVEALEKITEVVIPDCITAIGAGAFRGCSGLKSVEIPEGVAAIADGTFVGCSSLESINIPESVVIIGDEAFWGCETLTSVAIPASVASIGAFAFGGCWNLTSITIAGKDTSLGQRSIPSGQSVTVHAPAGSYAESYAKENNIPFVAE